MKPPLNFLTSCPPSKDLTSSSRILSLKEVTLDLASSVLTSNTRYRFSLRPNIRFYPAPFSEEKIFTRIRKNSSSRLEINPFEASYSTSSSESGLDQIGFSRLYDSSRFSSSCKFLLILYSEPRKFLRPIKKLLARDR